MVNPEETTYRKILRTTLETSEEDGNKTTLETSEDVAKITLETSEHHV